MAQIANRMYSEEEYTAIINYILATQEYNRLRTDSFWIEMEEAGICKAKNRSWSSMKETFRKRIYHRLMRKHIKIPMEQLIALNKAYEHPGLHSGTSRKSSRSSNKKKAVGLSCEELLKLIKCDDEEKDDLHTNTNVSTRNDVASNSADPFEQNI